MCGVSCQVLSLIFFNYFIHLVNCLCVYLFWYFSLVKQFHIYLKIFLCPCSFIHDLYLSFPHSLIQIIPRQQVEINIQIAQNFAGFGIKFCAAFLQKTLDKFCEVWYTEKFDARPSRARRQKKKPVFTGFSHILFAHFLGCSLRTALNGKCLFAPPSPTYKAVGVVHIYYTHKGATMRESCLRRLGLTYSTCEFRSSRLPYLNSEIIITSQEDDVKHFLKIFLLPYPS